MKPLCNEPWIELLMPCYFAERIVREVTTSCDRLLDSHTLGRRGRIAVRNSAPNAQDQHPRAGRDADLHTTASSRLDGPERGMRSS
jgi:hypothetical protein